MLDPMSLLATLTRRSPGLLGVRGAGRCSRPRRPDRRWPWAPTRWPSGWSRTASAGRRARPRLRTERRAGAVHEVRRRQGPERWPRYAGRARDAGYGARRRCRCAAAGRCRCAGAAGGSGNPLTRSRWRSAAPGRLLGDRAAARPGDARKPHPDHAVEHALTSRLVIEQAKGCWPRGTRCPWTTPSRGCAATHARGSCGCTRWRATSRREPRPERRRALTARHHRARPGKSPRPRTERSRALAVSASRSDAVEYLVNRPSH
ncbi:hypothetical protein NKH77_31735 [Streptomyces sp. M19]